MNETVDQEDGQEKRHYFNPSNTLYHETLVLKYHNFIYMAAILSVVKGIEKQGIEKHEREHFLLYTGPDSCYSLILRGMV